MESIVVGATGARNGNPVNRRAGCLGLGSRRGLRGPHDPALESADRLRAVCTQAYLASAIGGAEARVLPAAESDDVGAVHNDDEEPTYRRVWSSRRRRDRHAAAADRVRAGSPSSRWRLGAGARGPDRSGLSARPSRYRRPDEPAVGDLGRSRARTARGTRKAPPVPASVRTE
jgi:hypothetical protein